MPPVRFHLENVRLRLSRARDLAETRNFLSEILALSDGQILQLFDVGSCSPQEIHGLRDQIFTSLVDELIRNGWNCNAPAFGTGRRDSFLMEVTRRGYSRCISYLLQVGADANYNTRGYGDSTALMCTRDTHIMEILLSSKANPTEVNALNQTDFTYKLLSGVETSVRFYVQNAANMPFQDLLDNFHDCIMNHETAPYGSMYPLCPVPVVPEDCRYDNIVDKPLIDAMIANQYLPFSSQALNYPIKVSNDPLAEPCTVWQYIRTRMREAMYMSPSLLVALMTCMSKSTRYQTMADFAMLEQYIAKPAPRALSTDRIIAKMPFIYMLFALGELPPTSLIRWLMLLGKIIRSVALWMDILGEDPFRVSTTLQGQDTTNPRPNAMGQKKTVSHMLQELTTIQSLLAMRVNVPDSFSEIQITTEMLD